MTVKLRPGKPEDAQACGQICYEAFKRISSAHNFPRDFPSVEAAVELISSMLGKPGIYSVIAEQDGQIIGSNFSDERSTIAAIGPITVDHQAQNKAIGRQLMKAVIQHAQNNNHAGIRLLQAAYHNRSLSLYTKLGFVTREPISTLQGKPLRLEVPGHKVRAATAEDLATCDQLCMNVHGHLRHAEVSEAIKRGHAQIVEYDDTIIGYSTMLAFFGHSVATTNEAMKALIAAAPAFPGPGFLLPTRNSELLRWCLEHGLQVVQPMTLMSMGLYNEPAGAFLPSVLY